MNQQYHSRTEGRGEFILVLGASKNWLNFGFQKFTYGGKCKKYIFLGGDLNLKKYFFFLRFLRVQIGKVNKHMFQEINIGSFINLLVECLAPLSRKFAKCMPRLKRISSLSHQFRVLLFIIDSELQIYKPVFWNFLDASQFFFFFIKFFFFIIF